LHRNTASLAFDRSGLHPAETFCMPFRRACVDSNHDGLWIGKRFYIRALQPVFSALFRPETTEDCASMRVSASLARASFPLFPGNLVETSGQLNAWSHFVV
jgi:hypothetical protein